MTADIDVVRRGVTVSICSVLVVASCLITHFGAEAWFLPLIVGSFGLVIGLLVTSLEASQ